MGKYRKWVFQGVLLVLFLSSNVGFALDFQSARTVSLGRTGRGGAQLTDVIFLNPALSGFYEVSALSGTYHWQSGSTHPWNASIVDGKNEYVHAGLSFTRNPHQDWIHLTLARKITPWLSVGNAVKRYSARSNQEVAEGRAESGYDFGLSTAFLLPLSFLAAPVQVGVVSENLVNRAKDEPQSGPRQYGVGVKANLSKIVMVYADFVEHFSNFSGAYPFWGAGAELNLGANIFGRGGIFQSREQGWSVGFGWISPRFVLNYGFQKSKQNAVRTKDHAVTLDLYM